MTEKKPYTFDLKDEMQRLYAEFPDRAQDTSAARIYNGETDIMHNPVLVENLSAYDATYYQPFVERAVKYAKRNNVSCAYLPRDVFSFRIIIMNDDDALQKNIPPAWRDYVRCFTFMHETAHLTSAVADPRTASNIAPDAETVADIYATLRIAQRFGPDIAHEVATMIFDIRAARYLATADSGYMTTIALDRLLAKMPDTKNMTPADCLAAAESAALTPVANDFQLLYGGRAFTAFRATAEKALHRDAYQKTARLTPKTLRALAQEILNTNDRFHFYTGAAGFAAMIVPDAKPLGDIKIALNTDERKTLCAAFAARATAFSTDAKINRLAARLAGIGKQIDDMNANTPHKKPKTPRHDS